MNKSNEIEILNNKLIRISCKANEIERLNKKLIRISCKAGPDGWGKTSMMMTSKVRKRSLSVRREKEGPNCHTRDFVLVFHAYLT